MERGLRASTFEGSKVRFLIFLSSIFLSSAFPVCSFGRLSHLLDDQTRQGFSGERLAAEGLETTLSSGATSLYASVLKGEAGRPALL